jgi:uncharacterized protein (UPF0261 family)
MGSDNRNQIVLMIGSFDSKGFEYAFLREQIVSHGLSVCAVNTGILGSTDLFPVDVEADEIARAGGSDIQTLREKKDRGTAMKVMTDGIAKIVQSLYQERRFDGMIGMGGSGGTTVITSGMRVVPLGVPKVCISTTASGDTSPYVGTKDITMIPSIVDIAGINRISRIILARAAGAICGMVTHRVPTGTEDKSVITASMFGNTTECVNTCTKLLSEKGYETLVFHATGTGGRTMESLVDEGLVDGVLDITTTEWADEICGGMFSAGSDRLSAPGRSGVPHLIVPGCIDMVNYGSPETIPETYKHANRIFYEWNPSVTLMRTNVEENRQMGEIFAAKANEANGPVAFLIPLQGVSILDGPGQPFCDREADSAMFDTLKANLNKNIPVRELDTNINDDEFAGRAVEMMLELIAKQK